MASASFPTLSSSPHLPIATIASVQHPSRSRHDGYVRKPARKRGAPDSEPSLERRVCECESGQPPLRTLRGRHRAVPRRGRTALKFGEKFHGSGRSSTQPASAWAVAAGNWIRDRANRQQHLECGPRLDRSRARFPASSARRRPGQRAKNEPSAVDAPNSRQNAANRRCRAPRAGPDAARRARLPERARHRGRQQAREQRRSIRLCELAKRE